MFKTLERMGIDQKLVRLIQCLYLNPRYKVEIEGVASAWHTQHAGIRQGCPLSPYLFLIIMTAMFHDIHAQPDLQEQLRKNRIPGATFDEVLYADDTILVSESKVAIQKLLHAIEVESERYGMRLNLKKCEVVQLNSSEDIRFRNGVVVPPHDEVKYLGCMLNEKGDPQKEVNKRLSETIVTWRRLADFWKHSNCSCKTKLQVYDAVVRTKLMYGLETLQLNESIKKKLDAFQLRGLRQILKLPTTYMDRQYTNEFVYEEANIVACSQPIGEQGGGKIIRISQYYESQRINTLVDLIKAPADDPRKSITIDADTLKLIDLPRWRVRRPRNNW